MTAPLSTSPAIFAAEAEPNQWLIYGLMLLAGLVLGGAWAAREHNKVLSIILGVLGLLALVAAILWIYG